MNDQPKESDWKLFRKMVPELREQWLRKRNVAIAELLANPDRTPTEQFWDAEEQLSDDVRHLRECFDDHRRSRLFIKMLAMLRRDIMNDEDLAGFSEELRERLLEAKSF